MTIGSGPPAGWYPYPSMAGTQRYWDGARWTDHMAPLAPARIQVPPNNDTLKVVGWLCVFLFPVAAFVIGFVIGSRSEQTHGLVMVLASVAASTVWYLGASGSV